MQTLKGRTCVFAGATAGDGVAAVKALCAAGMNVVMMTHNAERARALVEEVNGMGFPGVCRACGAGESGPAEENPAIYEALEREFGSVDVVISNTGGPGHTKPMESVTGEELTREMGHLVAGAFNMLKAALPSLRRSRAPRVILMTSAEGVRGGIHEGFANAVAKGSVRALALNAAARLAPEGITVNCIAKGAIPRVEGVRPGDVEAASFLPLIPMGRTGTLEDLAELICFLASEESGYITGQTIGLTGGLELRG